MCKYLLANPAKRLLIIVCGWESVNWSESAEFQEILAGNYPKGPNYYEWVGRLNGRNGNGSSNSG